MANATTMTYGAYSFSPVPLMNINKEYNKTDDGIIIGSIFVVTLQGTLTQLPADPNASYVTIDSLQDAVRSAFDQDGKLFEVMCDATTLLQAYPRIRSITFEQSNNNWVFTSPFTIELEFDDEIDLDENSTLHPPYIETASESWTVEFAEDQMKFDLDLSTVTGQEPGHYYGSDSNPFQVRVTHNISAKGKSHYSGPGSTGTLDRAAWQEAREYVIGKLGIDTQHISSSGVLNLQGGDFSVYNHMRQVETNEVGGEFSVSETWIAIDPSGSGEEATEDFTISVRRGIDSGLTTVSIEGTIQGLETRDYGTNPGDYSVTTTAYSAAESYFNGVLPRLFSRAQFAGDSTATRSFNPTPVSQTVGHSPARGQISYSLEYNDRPCTFITGALSENITINDTLPSDVFAQLTILGRSRGPVLQSVSTVTAFTREIIIEAVMEPFTNCGSIADLNLNRPETNVKNLLCAFETDLVATYDTVFKSGDTVSWNPMTGRYTRAVTYTFGNCTGPAPTISLCL